MADSLLEPDYADVYDAWKKAPGPATNNAILTKLHPVIEGAVRTHVGQSNPLLLSSARRLALQGLRGYDPSRGRLATHLYNHLLGLKRVNRQQSGVLRVPERVALQHAHLDDAVRELGDELGREPTDDELADRLGVSLRRLAKVRSYHPAVAEGALSVLGDPFAGGVAGPPDRAAELWRDAVYDELDDHHKKVMELAFGLRGRRPLQNQEIARRLRRSPGAISQAKARIQAMLDEQYELGPGGLVGG